MYILFMVQYCKFIPCLVHDQLISATAAAWLTTQEPVSLVAHVYHNQARISCEAKFPSEVRLLLHTPLVT
jgi:hypothetical protein